MFEIFQSEKTKEFYFRLRAKNAQTILSSEGYKSKASCKNGIRSVQKNAAAENFNLLKAKNGKVYFTIEARNGEVVGKSQMYKSTGGRSKGIASVINNARNAETKDLTA